MLGALVGSVLGLLDGRLQLLNLLLKQLVAVVEGCDLLFLGQVLLLQCLDLALQLLDLLVGIISLQTEGGHALSNRLLAP